MTKQYTIRLQHDKAVAHSTTPLKSDRLKGYSKNIKGWIRIDWVPFL